MKTDIEKDGLVGRVRSLHIEIKEISNQDNKHKLLSSQNTKYDIRGCKTEEEYCGEDGGLILKKIFFYNADEKLSEVRDYQDGNILVTKCIYLYNPKGYLMEVTRYEDSGSLVNRRLIRYDLNGKMSEEVEYHTWEGSKAILIHDKKGNEIDLGIYGAEGTSLIKTIYDSREKINSVIFCKADESIIHRIDFAYDMDGDLADLSEYIGKIFFKQRLSIMAKFILKLIKKAIFFNEDAPFRKTTFRYDTTGRLNEKSTYIADSLLSKKIYFYDDKGNKIEESIYSADGSVIQKVGYAYEVDLNGNWTKQTRTKWCVESAESISEIVMLTNRIVIYY